MLRNAINTSGNGTCSIPDSVISCFKERRIGSVMRVELISGEQGDRDEQGTRLL